MMKKESDFPALSKSSISSALFFTFSSLILLAAHALRRGEPGLAAALIFGGGLVFTRQAWARLVLIPTLGLGSLLWTKSGMDLVHIRLLMDEPRLRLACILAVVLAVFVLAFGLILGRPGRSWFDRNPEYAQGRALVFLFTAGALSAASHMVPFPILLLERYAPGFGRLETALLALYASRLWQKIQNPLEHTRLRPYVWGGFSLAFFSQFALGLSGLENMLMTGTLHLPIPALITAGPVYRGGGWFMLGLFLSTIVLTGPAWCSHLCYIGSWDLGFARSGRAKPRSLGRWIWTARALTLAGTVGMAWILKILGASHSTAAFTALAFAFIGMGIMVLISRRLGVMAHCTLWCPIGLLASVLGRINPWRIVMNDKCTQCGLCSRACLYSALETRHIGNHHPGPSCTLCGDCLAACPHQALEFRLWSLPWPQARSTFLGMVICLHAVFLGLARI